MWRALLPEMLMCSCSLSISGLSDSWKTSSSSFSFFVSSRPSVGGLAKMGFTTPTWGMVTGMGGRAGVTPARKTQGQAWVRAAPGDYTTRHTHLPHTASASPKDATLVLEEEGLCTHQPSLHTQNCGQEGREPATRTVHSRAQSKRGCLPAPLGAPEEAAGSSQLVLAGSGSSSSTHWSQLDTQRGKSH